MTTENLEAPGLAKDMSMTSLLRQLGFEPTKASGNEILYHNVFIGNGDGIKNSLRINNELGVWFDKVLGKGGDIVDFGLAYWRSLNRIEVIKKLNHMFSVGVQKEAANYRVGRKRMAVKIPHYQLQEIRPTGSNPQISSYLEAEGLIDIHNNQIKEVYYYVIDQKGTRKDFFSAGWQNENGGWEIRSRFYSGCIGPRGMTFIPGQKDELFLFENLSQFLAQQVQEKIMQPNILVLNSPDFFNAAVQRASKFSAVTAFLTTDRLNADFMGAMDALRNKHNH